MGEFWVKWDGVFLKEAKDSLVLWSREEVFELYLKGRMIIKIFYSPFSWPAMRNGCAIVVLKGCPIAEGGMTRESASSASYVIVLESSMNSRGPEKQKRQCHFVKLLAI